MLRSFRPLPTESIRLIVFDLDGTLIDSRRDLCNSVNAMLTHFGLAPLHDDTIASYVGDGAGMLVRRALAVPGEIPAGSRFAEPAFFDEAFAYFLAYYREHKLDYTTIYPGVIESLEALRTLPDGSPRPMAVLTNKPVGPARAICDGLGLSPYFFDVYGGDSFATKKPDPLGLNTLITQAGVNPEKTLMIGDSGVDVQTARNAGTWVLGCTFGLAPHSLELTPPDTLVHHASEWITALSAAEIRA